MNGFAPARNRCFWRYTASTRNRAEWLREMTVSTKPQQITENSEGRARRLANLKPFKPGQSGNPGGRPRGIFGRTALKRLLRRAKNGDSQLVALIDAQIDKAIRKRDTRAAEFLRDSVDGRPSAQEQQMQVGIAAINILWGGAKPDWATIRASTRRSAVVLNLPNNR